MWPLWIYEDVTLLSNNSKNQYHDLRQFSLDDYKEIILTYFVTTVDSRYLDFGYLEWPLISKRKSGPSLNIEI